LSQQVKNLLWDFDGVILDSNHVRNEGFEIVLKDFPINQVEALLDFHKANGGISRYYKFRYFFEEIRQEKKSEQELQVYFDDFTQIMRKRLLDKSLLIKETTQFVMKNYNQYQMHIVSGSDQNELRFLCNYLEIEKYFHSINGSPTPKGELIKNVMEKGNMNTYDTLMIGDAINDYDAAKLNGIHFFAYNNSNLNQFNTIQIDLAL
jgi:HAD superfamily hydrolase (TIGR01549 family)